MVQPEDTSKKRSRLPWISAVAGAGVLIVAASMVLEFRSDRGLDERVDDSTLEWSTDLQWRIVADGSTGLLLSRLLPTDIAVTQDGQIVVLDRVGRKLYVVSRAGVVTDSLGGRGSGPGELVRPVNAAIDREGQIAVMDRGKGAFVRWSAETRVPLDQWRAPAQVAGSAIPGPGGVVYRTLGIMSDTMRYSLVVVNGDSSQTIANGPPVTMRNITVPSCGIDVSTDPVFTPRLAWTAAGSRVIVAADADYSLDILEGGKRVARVTRSVPRRSVTRAMALRELEGYAVGDCEVPPADVVEAIGYASELPAIAELRVSPTGGIWARRTTIKDEPVMIDVFNADGAYKGSLANFPFPAAFISDDLFIAISVNEFDVPSIRAYSIRKQ